MDSSHFAEFADLHFDRGMLKSARQFLDITARRQNPPHAVMGCLMMMESVERAERYLAEPFGVSDPDRRALIEEMIEDCDSICENARIHLT